MSQFLIKVAAGLLVLGVAAAGIDALERSRERRHARRPEVIAEAMLALARVTPADTVYDLECGDGTAAVMAAQRYGARVVCVDLYARRIDEARARATAAGVAHLITFQTKHWGDVDVAPATVVIGFLTRPTGRPSKYPLRGQLTRQLHAGARIVLARDDFADWRPTKTVAVADERLGVKSIGLWIADGVVRPWME